MRRQAPPLPISPKQLKHFAIATVVLTGLLALLASGTGSGVAAEIDARKAKNDLVAAEQEKVGTKKVGTAIKVRDKSMNSTFADDSSLGDGGFGGSSSGGNSYAGPRAGPRPMPALQSPIGLQNRPGGTVTRKRMGKPPPKPGELDDPDQAGEDGTGGAPRPDMSRLEEVKQASRQRSGSANADGD
ncbi:MAG TPA: hypothetical protein VFV30_07255 [Novosphingobium sp.]|nr:hypothetical protein [Novosphingobium sp.]